MGLFSGVKKLVSKAAPIVGAGLGAFYGGPAGMAAGSSMGSAIGGMFGGGQSSAKNPQTSTGYDWLDTGIEYAGSAMNIWNAYNDIMNTKDQNERARKMQDIAMSGYDNSLQGIIMQNATAKQLADEGNAWNRQNMEIAQNINRSNMYEQQQYNRENMGLQYYYDQMAVDHQMDYNTRMANSAHQRETADLRAAGLNPILSGTGGMGAPTPAAAAPSVSSSNPSSAHISGSSANVAPVRSQGDAITSAFSAFSSMAKAMEATAATNFMSGAQTAKTQADTELSRSNVDLNTTRSRLNQDQSLKIASEIQNLKAIRENIPKSGQLTEAQTANMRQSTKNLKEVFRELKVKGDISQQDQAYWNNLIDQSGGSAAGTLQLLNSLRQLLK